MVELSESDSGGERSVAVGDDVVIRLTENRTAGYRWSLPVPGDAFAVVDDTYQPAAIATASGRQMLRLSDALRSPIRALPKARGSAG